MLKKKAPAYLFNKGQMVGSVTFSVLFAIVFLNIYTPFSSSAWFDLSKEAFFVGTIGVLAIATALMVLSRVVLFYFAKWRSLSVFQYGIWMVVEIASISLFYSVITWRYFNPNSLDFLQVLTRSMSYTFLILVIPYAIAILYSALNDREQTLRLLTYSTVASDHPEPTDENAQVIYLTDNNGNLRLSVRMENLYFIESQDNYIVVHYMNKGTLCDYTLRCKLKTVEDTCAGSSLVRCHRSFIINTKKVKILRREREGLFVDMDCPGVPAIPISKSYCDVVLRYFR